MFCWEIPFADLIRQSRVAEIGYVFKYSCLKGVNMAVNFFESKLIVFVTILCLVLIGKELEAVRIFPAIYLFHILQMSVCIYIPKAVESSADAYVAFQHLRCSSRTMGEPRHNECQLKAFIVAKEWSQKI